jgi:triacylglycerol lipase
VQIIVLHHGLMGYNTLRWGPARVAYWDGIGEAICQAGYPVFITSVHPTAGIARRAQELKDQLLERLGKQPDTHGKLVIFAHSMGGLDARYMIGRLGMADHVDALVTIGTPHRGSAYYDHLISSLGMLGRMPFLRDLVVDVRAFWEVTMAHTRRFNEQVPDVPGVHYYSVTASCTPDRVPPWLHRAYPIILKEQGENDGMVAVASSRWGMELGHWPFHHYHLVNWPMRLFSPPSREDVRPRYLQLLSLLRTDGALDEPAGQFAAVQPLPGMG